MPHAAEGFLFLPMTFGELLYECGELGNQSNRVEIDWRRFVNRAIRRIAQRRDWTMMRDQRQVTINQGALSAPLDANFKKLTDEKSPISYIDPTTTYQLPIPCIVISRAEADRMGYNPFFAPYPVQLNAFPLRYVFVEKDGPDGRWKLFIPQQYVVNPTVVFNVGAYYYPNDLHNAEDHNGFTDHPELCDAIINLTKATAYFAEEPDSEKGAAAMKLYELAYKQAAYSDAAQRLMGRALAM
jgi:hypothetical protein